jgi:hypothetical protein
MIQNHQLKEWYQKNKADANNALVKILGVEYAHIRLKNDDDIYITALGLPFIEQVQPDNFWTDEAWFRNNSERLVGTSCPYKIRTKAVDGVQVDLVVKWNRMGQEIPGAGDSEDLLFAAFNSPFEEFSLVFELREAMQDQSPDIFIQKPLAIYVPSGQVKLAEIGRKEYKMRHILKSHIEVAVDMFRSYMVIYEWIPGIDLFQAVSKSVFEENTLKALTRDAQQKMRDLGFVVSDFKPQHVIIEPNGQESKKTQPEEEASYALVDFELLLRTPAREQIVKKSKRQEYLKRQKDRFNIDIPKTYHPHLHHVAILDVDYVYGHVESTKGSLWVLGKDPCLFDYFLPERWENIPQKKISVFNKMFYTVSKDNIHLAWKASRVGLQPDMDPFVKEERKILDYGYNSPFEEASIAIHLSRAGIPTIYPRAIYMKSSKIEISEILVDKSRYESHQSLQTPEGRNILEERYDYISIWGYWNGPDDKLANKDGDYYEGINLLQAYRSQVIAEALYFKLLRKTKRVLLKAGYEDLNYRGNHLLISMDSRKQLVLGDDGLPEVRICNFEFLKRIK